ncbi:M48 family metallopeptidase [Pleionea sp. CnH1-48]|uniref:tetratricopeptide repeat protein n=1 Tax=Pleionea sp. CnH1-48 TaxID=2954494 RepID=UPI0020972023|nr:tetratricopeptide repeat protein [Pleionea sp. CnH1-48]MCO7227465.1 tetratricopeptide repeat protein [Pleionea sp. CnH1-48]
MKIYVLALSCLLVSMSSLAEVWRYDTKQLLVPEKTGQQAGQALNLTAVNYYIRRISQHARYYPPSFDNDKQRQDITIRLQALMAAMQTAMPEKADERFLARAAFVYTMGHNLDLKGATDKAKQFYEQLLALYPSEPSYNYRYGLFMAETRKYHEQGIPFIEKALKLGHKEAAYTLGLLYFHQGKKEQALELLNAYAAMNPEHVQVKRIIEAIKKDQFEVTKE